MGVKGDWKKDFGELGVAQGRAQSSEGASQYCLFCSVSIWSLLAVFVCCTFTCMQRDLVVEFSRVIQKRSHFTSHPQQGYEPNSHVLMFGAGTADTAATAQQMPIPGKGNVPLGVAIEQETTLGELTRVWTLGVGSRPKEWNCESSGFDNSAFKILNGWLGFLETRRGSWRNL